ncbi:MAG: hypothetical protein ACFFD4_19295 [Candidatus Odinarchaeota archaeon]
MDRYKTRQGLITGSDMYYPQCSLIIDRDYNSSINIEIEGLTTLDLVQPESLPVEAKTSTLMLDYFNTIPCVKVSLVTKP